MICTLRSFPSHCSFFTSPLYYSRKQHSPNFYDSAPLYLCFHSRAMFSRKMPPIRHFFHHPYKIAWIFDSKSPILNLQNLVTNCKRIGTRQQTKPCVSSILSSILIPTHVTFGSSREAPHPWQVDELFTLEACIFPWTRTQGNRWGGGELTQSSSYHVSIANCLLTRCMTHQNMTAREPRKFEASLERWIV